jgi:aspartate kinase
MCKNCRRIDRVSYEELLETAGAGAKVVHMHAVELAAKKGLTIDLNKSPSIGGNGRTGTRVSREDIDMEEVLVATVAHTSNEAKLSVNNVPNKVGIAARIFEPLARANINVDMIVQYVAKDKTSGISFTIAKQDLKRALQLTEISARDVGAGKVEAAADVAKVSIVGIGMRSHAGVAARMFDVLAKEGIDIQMISTSEIKVSVVVDSKHVEKAVRALHEAFI